MFYDSAAIYIDSAITIQAKIAAIDLIQAALLTSALVAAEKGASEYQLNDGQTIIKMTYRSSSEIQSSYDAYEKIKQRLINTLNGRVVRLMDSKNFTGRRYGW